MAVLYMSLKIINARTKDAAQPAHPCMQLLLRCEPCTAAGSHQSSSALPPCHHARGYPGTSAAPSMSRITCQAVPTTSTTHWCAAQSELPRRSRKPGPGSTASAPKEPAPATGPTCAAQPSQARPAPQCQDTLNRAAAATSSCSQLLHVTAAAAAARAHSRHCDQLRCSPLLDTARHFSPLLPAASLPSSLPAPLGLT